MAWREGFHGKRWKDERDKTYRAKETRTNLRGGGNLIINGGFDIWQRGTSQEARGILSDDRWMNFAHGTTIAHSRQEFPAGQTEVPGNPRFFSRTVVNSAQDSHLHNARKWQRIEDVRRLSGKTVTVSFWARADAGKKITVELAQDFDCGAGTALSNAIGVKKFELSANWRRYAHTVHVPTVQGKIVGDGSNSVLTFWFDCHTEDTNAKSRSGNIGPQSGTFDIAQVKLEEGSVSTPFVPRLPGEELLLCQRYYWHPQNNAPRNLDTSDPAAITRDANLSFEYVGVSHYNNGAGGGSCSVMFPVEMRIPPTVVFFGISNGQWFQNRNGTVEAVAMHTRGVTRKMMGINGPPMPPTIAAYRRGSFACDAEF